jgi:hypothetical protein
MHNKLDKMEYVPAPEVQVWASVKPFKYVPRLQPTLTAEQLIDNAEFCAVADDNRARGWSND